jgi:hypothetical protein
MVERAPRRGGSKVPANLRPYVEALGAEGAERFFLALGGSQVYVAGTRGAQERGIVAQTVGNTDDVLALAKALEEAGYSGYVKVPLARRWLAENMLKRGLSDNEIARTVRADVATVRRWFCEDDEKSAA